METLRKDPIPVETSEQNTVGTENVEPLSALQTLNHSLATEAVRAVAIDLAKPQKRKKKSKPPTVSAKKIKLLDNPVTPGSVPEVRFC